MHIIISSIGHPRYIRIAQDKHFTKRCINNSLWMWKRCDTQNPMPLFYWIQFILSHPFSFSQISYRNWDVKRYSKDKFMSLLKGKSLKIKIRKASRRILCELHERKNNIQGRKKEHKIERCQKSFRRKII